MYCFFFLLNFRLPVINLSFEYWSQILSLLKRFFLLGLPSSSLFFRFTFLGFIFLLLFNLNFRSWLHFRRFNFRKFFLVDFTNIVVIINISQTDMSRLIKIKVVHRFVNSSCGLWWLFYGDSFWFRVSFLLSWELEFEFIRVKSVHQKFIPNCGTSLPIVKVFLAFNPVQVASETNNFCPPVWPSV